MGCGYKIVLHKNMSYGEYIIRDDILWENISYRRTFLMGGNFWLENMSYERICLTGGYVLQKDMSYRRTGLTGGMP